MFFKTLAPLRYPDGPHFEPGMLSNVGTGVLDGPKKKPTMPMQRFGVENGPSRTPVPTRYETYNADAIFRRGKLKP